MDKYETGTSAVDITPPVGAPILGNYREDYASRGVHTPLYSRTLVLRRDGDTLAIISNDLGVITEELAEEVRREISDQCDLDPRHIMVTSTHTHSGPAIWPIAGEANPAEMRALVRPGIVASCLQAMANLRPMPLWAGMGTAEDVCFNRRLKLKDGRTVMNWERPDSDEVDHALGPIDPTVAVLAGGETV